MSKFESKYEEGILTEDEAKVEKPNLYKVILLNDDYTPMDFVVLVLKKFFYKTDTEASHIMLNVHKKGHGITGIFTYEIAETKIQQVHSFAEKNSHPLKCTIERE